MGDGKGTYINQTYFHIDNGNWIRIVREIFD